MSDPLAQVFLLRLNIMFKYSSHRDRSRLSNLWLSQSCLRSRRLQLVEDALDRIERGTFGVCQDCGRAVEEKRLKAIPWAHLCLECQETKEALEFLPLKNQYGKASSISRA